ncbi:contact-dependent growth inhibition system immunity protein [Paenibacillus elgii]|uniref:contact-dependent growth inhibition system immunity protein n=1 Tax=Paenibacillus elgii TaxID=189691 RepID=UPI000248D7AA|nr:contact-dependent growth inhibition system immunity protein [Paenibacillus elgii]
MLVDYGNLTVDEIAKLEGFHDEIEVDPRLPLSKWFFKVKDIKLKDLDDGDIARLIRQDYHLFYVLPEAMKRLRKNPLSGRSYEGELLNSFDSIQDDFWTTAKGYKENVTFLLNEILSNPYYQEGYEWSLETEKQEFYDLLNNLLIKFRI